MKILYQVPHLNTIYAGRTVYHGYKDAFEDLGHEFQFLTADTSLAKKLEDYPADILITSIHSYNLRFLDLVELKRAKMNGLKVFVNMTFWNSPISKFRFNEASSLKDNESHVNLIKSGEFGDVYYNMCEPEDPRMEGFEEETGYKHFTIPLAANAKQYFYEFDSHFKRELSFIGTYLPDKEEFMQKNLFPLREKYDLKLYGQDWTIQDKLRGFISKVGMYFNLPIIKNLQKSNLELSDERKIYSSSTISLNIHENYQKEFGGDCNERTFKIPLSGGFEITDDVACIRKYFKEGEEIIIAKDSKDWFEKIDYYLKNPDKRESIIKAGKARVAKDHTYHNRVSIMLSIYENL